MVSTLQVFCSSGSGFIVESIKHLDFNISKYKPVKGSSYIPTSLVFSRNHFLLNNQNKDQKCFAYSLLAALFPSSTHNKQEAVPYKKILGKLVLDKN